MNDIKQHIYLPIPSIKDQPRPGSETRDERLKAIIANLDKQHQQVRNNIVNAAISHYRTSLATQTKNFNDEAMDLDLGENPPTSPPQDSGPYNDATFALIANLSTPHDPKMGDPCLPPGGRIVAPPGIVQVEPPEGVRVAKEVLERIAEYDAQARAGREYYARALERRGSGSAGIEGATNGVEWRCGQIHPDRMRQVESSDPFGRRW